MKRFAVFTSAVMLISLLFVGLSLGISYLNLCPFFANSDLKKAEKPIARILFLDPRARLEIQNLIDRRGKTCEREFFRVYKDISQAGLSTTTGAPSQTYWHQDYALATQTAQQQEKMLLIYFCDPQGDCDCPRFRSETLDDPWVRSKLQDYVCLQLPLDASVIVDGKKVVLLEHEAFKEMLGKPGIAIIDYQHHDPQLHGTVVSTFPLVENGNA